MLRTISKLMILSLCLSACSGIGGSGFSPSPLGGFNSASGVSGASGSTDEKKGNDGSDPSTGNGTETPPPGGSEGGGGSGSGASTVSTGSTDAGKSGDTGGSPLVVASTGGTVSSSTTTPDVGTDDPCFRSPYGPGVILEKLGNPGGLRITDRKPGPVGPLVSPNGFNFGDQTMRVCDLTGLPADPSASFGEPSCVDSVIAGDGSFSIPNFDPDRVYFFILAPKGDASGLLDAEGMLNLGQSVINCQLNTHKVSLF